MSAVQQQHYQTQMAIITQEVQKQSGDQVQQALQTLEREAAVVRQDLGGLRNWTGGAGSDAAAMVRCCRAGLQRFQATDRRED